MRITRVFLLATLVLGLSPNARAQSPEIGRSPLLGPMGKVRLRSSNSTDSSPSSPTGETSESLAILGDGTPVVVHQVSGPPPLHVISMKLLAPGIGWALVTGRRLYRTENAGTDWRDITASLKGSNGATIEDVFFLDTRRGWVLFLTGFRSVPGKPDGEPQFDLAATSDSGATWETYQVTIPPQEMENPERLFPDLTGQGKINFVDPAHGWMNLAGEGSADQGRLLVTSDGGRSWSQAPGDREEWASIVLVTPEEGWLVGGGGSNELYVTRDGAKSFEQVSLAAPPELSPVEGSSEYSAVYGLPTFEDRKRGFLPVTYSGGEKVRSATVLFVTDDGGRTWTVDRILKDLEDAGGLGIMPSTVVNSGFGLWRQCQNIDPHFPNSMQVQGSMPVSIPFRVAPGSSKQINSALLLQHAVCRS